MNISIKSVQGDIVDEAEFGGYDVVLQNCNCQRRMGAGVALSIARAWPEVEAADKETRVHRGKLGTFTSAHVTRGDVTFQVFNLYGQFRYGPAREKHFDIDHFDRALERLARYLKREYGDRTLNILFPPIGVGTGGRGCWNSVVSALLTHLGNHNLTLITLPPRNKED